MFYQLLGNLIYEIFFLRYLLILSLEMYCSLLSPRNNIIVDMNGKNFLVFWQQLFGGYDFVSTWPGNGTQLSGQASTG